MYVVFYHHGFCIKVNQPIYSMNVSKNWVELAYHALNWQNIKMPPKQVPIKKPNSQPSSQQQRTSVGRPTATGRGTAANRMVSCVFFVNSSTQCRLTSQ